MSSTGGKVRTGVTGDEVGVIGEGVGGVTGEGVGDVMGCCCGDDAGTGAFVGGSSVGSVRVVQLERSMRTSLAKARRIETLQSQSSALATWVDFSPTMP